MPFKKNHKGYRNKLSYQNADKTIFKTKEYREKLSNSLIGKKKGPMSDKTKNKLSDIGKTKIGEKNNNYKDENICYKTTHYKIIQRYGQPKYCEICKSTSKKMYEWSNKDHKYSLKKEDWQRICRSCHTKYDHKYNI